MSSAIIFFSFMLVTSLTSVLGISINGMAINRIFYEMPIGVVNSSIALYQKDGEFNPYFNRTVLENNIKTYLTKSLKGYVPSYEIDFTYYRKTDNNEYVIDGSVYRRQVDVYFACTYSSFVRFEGRRGFEIERTDI